MVFEMRNNRWLEQSTDYKRYAILHYELGIEELSCSVHRCLNCSSLSWFQTGFGENCRVLDWAFRRCNGEDIADASPIGLVPKPDSLNLEGLGDINMKELFDIPKDYWLEECESLRTYYEEQLGEDLPEAISGELSALEERLKAAP